MLIKNDRKFFLGAVILLIFAGAGFYTLVYLPQRAELRSKQQLFNKRQAEMEFMERFMVSHPDTAAYEKSLMTKLDDVRARLPEAMDMSEALSELQRLAKNNGVIIKGVLPGKPAAKEKYVYQDVRIELRGRYHSLLDFFSALERQKRFCSFNGMTIKADADGLLGLLLDMRFYALAVE